MGGDLRNRICGLLLCAAAAGGCGAATTGPEGLISLRITPSLDSLPVGGTTRLSVILVARDSQAANSAVQWETLDATVVVMTAQGLARGVGAGTANVVAASGALSDTATLVVVASVGGPAGDAVTSIPLGHGPWDVTQSAQGLVYVTRPRTDSVARVDLASDRIAGSFQVGNRPDEVWFDALGTRAWVTNLDDRTVGVIDPLTHAQTATFAVPGEPLRLRLGPGEANLYVTLASGTVAVLDAGTGALTGSIAVGGTPNGLALSGDGSRLYVSTTSGGVAEVDTAADSILRTFATGGLPQDVVLAPGAGVLYVANEAGAVEFWDLTNGTRRTSLPVPGAFGLAVTPDGSQLWVTQPNRGTVTVIDCATEAVLRTILTFGTPRHIVITPLPLTAVVANEAGAVQIIR